LKVHFLLLPQTSTVYFESQHSTQLLFAYILQVFLESVVTHTKLKKDLYLMPHTPPDPKCVQTTESHTVSAKTAFRPSLAS